MRNGNHVDPRGKGENVPKFLREMQTLIPALEAKGIIGPRNREQARLLGNASMTDFLKKTTEDLAEAQRFRTWKVNTWFDEQMKTLQPRAFVLVKKTGWTWIFKALGYQFSITEGYEHSEEKNRTMPCTVSIIKRFWRYKTGIRMFWGEPESPKPTKTRIIKP